MQRIDRTAKIVLVAALVLFLLGFVRVWTDTNIFGKQKINSYEYFANCWMGDVRVCDLDPFNESYQRTIPLKDTEYLITVFSGYETGYSVLTHLPTRTELVTPNEELIFYEDGDVFWSPSRSYLLIRTHLNEFGGVGFDGLMLFFADAPTERVELFRVDGKNHPFPSTDIHLNYLTEDTISFTVESNVWKESKNTKEVTHYKYDVTAKKLLEQAPAIPIDPV